MDDRCSLPAACLELVLPFLPHSQDWSSISVTCRSSLSVTNRLKKSLCIKSALWLDRLLRRFPRISHLQFHTDFDTHNMCFDPRVRQSMSLHVDLSFVFWIISLYCPNLETILFPSSLRPASHPMHQLGLRCPKLRSLAFVVDADDACHLGQVVEALPMLERLDVDVEGKIISLDKEIRDTINVLNRLQALRVCSSASISEAYLRNLIRRGNPWKELLLSCARITKESAELLCQCCPDLEALEIDAQGFKDGRSCVQALSGLQKLRKLSLQLQHDYRFTKEGYFALLHTFPSLTHLSFACGKSVMSYGPGDFGEEEMMELAAGLLDLEALKVRLKHSCRPERGLSALLKGCKHLISISLTAGDLRFSSSYTVHNTMLQELQLLHCDLNSEILEWIAKSCPSLLSLDCRCAVDTQWDKAVNAIAQGCRKLRKLYINGSGFTLQDIAGCGNDVCFYELEELHIEWPKQSGVVGLIDGELLKMVQKCPRLRSLHMEHVKGRVSKRGVKKLLQCCRHLTSLSLSLEHVDEMDEKVEEVHLRSPFCHPYVFVGKR